MEVGRENYPSSIGAVWEPPREKKNTKRELSKTVTKVTAEKTVISRGLRVFLFVFQSLPRLFELV